MINMKIITLCKYKRKDSNRLNWFTEVSKNALRLLYEILVLHDKGNELKNILDLTNHILSLSASLTYNDGIFYIREQNMRFIFLSMVNGRKDWVSSTNKKKIVLIYLHFSPFICLSVVLPVCNSLSVYPFVTDCLSILL